MRTLHTETGILAPAGRVWTILADFPRWSEWNPFVTRLEGDLRVGAALLARLQLPGRAPMVMRPRIVMLETGRELRWLGALGVRGIFDGEHGFRVVPEAVGRCRFEQFETFSGLMATPILWLVETATREGFLAMNRALKARAERV